jgi:hypothetical protein
VKRRGGNGLKVTRTFVEEHVADGGGFFVDLEWMACQNYTFRNDTRRVSIKECSHSHQLGH